MIRPLGKRILVRPVVRARSDDGFVHETGLLLPDGHHVDTRDTALEGEVLAVSPQSGFSFKAIGCRVLYNKFSAVEIDDFSCIISDEDVIAAGPAPEGLDHLAGYIFLHDYLCLTPLPRLKPVTDAGIYLTEAYVAAHNNGFDPDESCVIQHGVARIDGVGMDAPRWLSAGDWVLFSYMHAIYRDLLGVERVMLRASSGAILAVLPEASVRERYGKEMCTYGRAT